MAGRCIDAPGGCISGQWDVTATALKQEGGLRGGWDCVLTGMEGLYDDEWAVISTEQPGCAKWGAAADIAQNGVMMLGMSCDSNCSPSPTSRASREIGLVADESEGCAAIPALLPPPRRPTRRARRARGRCSPRRRNTRARATARPDLHLRPGRGLRLRHLLDHLTRRHRLRQVTTPGWRRHGATDLAGRCTPACLPTRPALACRNGLQRVDRARRRAIKGLSCDNNEFVLDPPLVRHAPTRRRKRGSATGSAAAPGPGRAADALACAGAQVRRGFVAGQRAVRLHRTRRRPRHRLRRLGGSDNTALAAMGGGLGTVIAIGLLYIARQFARNKKDPQERSGHLILGIRQRSSAKDKPVRWAQGGQGRDVKVDATIHDV